ncbi:MAG: FAD-dependent oxidoreductase [Candidatus Methanoperedens sp.]|nr:FAD-dependent oxidoreductase [Candidatus Methanoperedens sp.]
MEKNVSESKYEPPGRAESFWIATTPETEYPSLTENVSVDVAILGGGIAGITSALFLKKAGLNVAVIESQRIIKGVTGYTTAHITSAHNLIYDYLIDHFGKDGAQQYADANQEAIERIAQLVEEHNIDCDFRRTSEYIYAESKEDVEKLGREFEAAKSLGLPVSYMDAAPLPFKTYGAIHYKNQAQFHPRKYLLSLAKLIPGNGSFIFENTRALDVEESEPHRIKTDRGYLIAKNVIIATHFPFLNQGMFFARMEPYRSYVLGVRIADEVPEEMFDSSKDPSHYIRTQPTPDGLLVIVGGEDHPTGHAANTVEHYERLEQFARNHFQIKSIDYHWSTQDNYSFDKVPFIGRFTPGSKHLYVATAFKGWGMTHGMVAATILSDLILGRSNPYQELYNPGRYKLLTTGGKLITQNIQIAETLLKGRLSRPEKFSSINIREAKVVDVKGEEVAVYKDDKGNIHAVSPACTHMGCIVSWNSAEKSWDCPCHGSRFNFNGEVIHSPAVKNLERKEIQE